MEDSVSQGSIAVVQVSSRRGPGAMCRRTPVSISRLRTRAASSTTAVPLLPPITPWTLVSPPTAQRNIRPSSIAYVSGMTT